MDLTRGEWAIVTIAIVWGVIQGAGTTPAMFVGSMVGAGILAWVLVAVKRWFAGGSGTDNADAAA